MVKSLEKIKKNPKGNYDEFLHKIQQHKMKELWDNDADSEFDKKE